MSADGLHAALDAHALTQTVAQAVQRQLPGVIEVLVHVGPAGTRRLG